MTALTPEQITELRDTCAPLGGAVVVTSDTLAILLATYEAASAIAAVWGPTAKIKGHKMHALARAVRGEP